MKAILVPGGSQKGQRVSKRLESIYSSLDWNTLYIHSVPSATGNRHGEYWVPDEGPNDAPSLPGRPELMCCCLVLSLNLSAWSRDSALPNRLRRAPGRDLLSRGSLADDRQDRSRAS